MSETKTTERVFSQNIWDPLPTEVHDHSQFLLYGRAEKTEIANTMVKLAISDNCNTFISSVSEYDFPTDTTVVIPSHVTTIKMISPFWGDTVTWDASNARLQHVTTVASSNWFSLVEPHLKTLKTITFIAVHNHDFSSTCSITHKVYEKIVGVGVKIGGPVSFSDKITSTGSFICERELYELERKLRNSK